MEVKRQGCQLFKSECGNIYTIVNNDVKISALHDYFLMQKGYCVDLLKEAQEVEEKNNEEWKNQNNITEECQQPCE